MDVGVGYSGVIDGPGVRKGTAVGGVHPGEWGKRWEYENAWTNKAIARKDYKAII